MRLERMPFRVGLIWFPPIFSLGITRTFEPSRRTTWISRGMVQLMPVGIGVRVVQASPVRPGRSFRLLTRSRLTSGGTATKIKMRSSWTTWTSSMLALAVT